MKIVLYRLLTMRLQPCRRPLPTCEHEGGQAASGHPIHANSGEVEFALKAGVVLESVDRCGDFLGAALPARHTEFAGVSDVVAVVHRHCHDIARLDQHGCEIEMNPGRARGAMRDDDQTSVRPIQRTVDGQRHPEGTSCHRSFFCKRRIEYDDRAGLAVRGQFDQADSSGSRVRDEQQQQGGKESAEHGWPERGSRPAAPEPAKSAAIDSAGVQARSYCGQAKPVRVARCLIVSCQSVCACGSRRLLLLPPDEIAYFLCLASACRARR